MENKEHCPSCRSGYTQSPLSDLCASCSCHASPTQQEGKMEAHCPYYNPDCPICPRVASPKEAQEKECVTQSILPKGNTDIIVIGGKFYAEGVKPTPPVSSDWKEKMTLLLSHLATCIEDKEIEQDITAILSRIDKLIEAAREEGKQHIRDSFTNGWLDKARQEERARLIALAEGIMPLDVGNWTEHAVKTIGLEALGKQDAANEGWNNCRNLIIELFGITKAQHE